MIYGEKRPVKTRGEVQVVITRKQEKAWSTVAKQSGRRDERRREHEGAV